VVWIELCLDLVFFDCVCVGVWFFEFVGCEIVVCVEGVRVVVVM